MARPNTAEHRTHRLEARIAPKGARAYQARCRRERKLHHREHRRSIRPVRGHASLVAASSCGGLSPVRRCSWRREATRLPSSVAPCRRLHRSLGNGNSSTFAELELVELLPLVDALPELMTPASAAPGVPSLAEPREGAKGGEQNQQSAVFLGVPKVNRTVVNSTDLPAIPLAVVA